MRSQIFLIKFPQNQIKLSRFLIFFSLYLIWLPSKRKDWDICETSFISFNLIMSERYQSLVHLKMNAHHLLILINFISRTENKLFWKMLQCFLVCKQWKSLELNVVFGPHWLSLYGQKQLKHSSIYLLLSSTEKESHSGLEQHESVPMTEFLSIGLIKVCFSFHLISLFYMEEHLRHLWVLTCYFLSCEVRLN